MFGAFIQKKVKIKIRFSTNVTRITLIGTSAACFLYNCFDKALADIITKVQIPHCVVKIELYSHSNAINRKITKIKH